MGYSRNVLNWVDNTIIAKDQPHGTTTGFAWRQFTDITNWGTMTQQTAGPSNSSWNSTQGIGQIYSSGDLTDNTSCVFARGGGWTFREFAGIETLLLNNQSNFSHEAVGFRCVK